MATNNSPETFTLWKEFVESTAGESLENFVEGQVKLHGSKTGNVVHAVLVKYGRFLKNKTVLLLVGNALAAGLVKVLGVRNPDAARVLYAAVRHLAGGATEGAAETLKAAKDDKAWDTAVKDAVQVASIAPAADLSANVNVYTHPEVAYGHRFDPTTGTTFCDPLRLQHNKHLAAHAGRTKVMKVPATDVNGVMIVDKNGRPTLTDQTVPDPVAFAATRHNLFEFVKGMDNRLCPSCFPHGAPEKPAEKKEEEKKQDWHEAIGDKGRALYFAFIKALGQMNGIEGTVHTDLAKELVNLPPKLWAALADELHSAIAAKAFGEDEVRMVVKAIVVSGHGSLEATTQMMKVMDVVRGLVVPAKPKPANVPAKDSSKEALEAVMKAQEESDPAKRAAAFRAAARLVRGH